MVVLVAVGISFGLFLLWGNGHFSAMEVLGCLVAAFSGGSGHWLVAECCVFWSRYSLRYKCLLPLLLYLLKDFMPVARKFHLLSLSCCIVCIRKAITRRKSGRGCSHSLALGCGGPMGVRYSHSPSGNTLWSLSVCWYLQHLRCSSFQVTQHSGGCESSGKKQVGLHWTRPPRALERTYWGQWQGKT